MNYQAFNALSKKNKHKFNQTVNISEQSKADIAESSFIWHEINHSYFAWCALRCTNSTYKYTYTYACNLIKHFACTHALKKVSGRAKKGKHKAIHQQTMLHIHSKQLKHIHIINSKRIYKYVRVYILVSILLGAQLLLVCWPLDIALPQQLKGYTGCLLRLGYMTEWLCDWQTGRFMGSLTHTHILARLRPCPWFCVACCCWRVALRLLLCHY